MGILKGKKALIVGVASNRSIAWSTAEFMHQQGAELAFTYLDDKLKNALKKLLKKPVLRSYCHVMCNRISKLMTCSPN